MDSLKEKMKTMPRVKVEATEQFVYEITNNGVTVAELIICLQEISFSPSIGNSNCKIVCYNPDGHDNKVTVVTH